MGQRALLTPSQRDLISGERIPERPARRSEAVSRVRNCIDNELVVDVDILLANQPDLYRDLVERAVLQNKQRLKQDHPELFEEIAEEFCADSE